MQNKVIKYIFYFKIHYNEWHNNSCCAVNIVNRSKLLPNAVFGRPVFMRNTLLALKM